MALMSDNDNGYNGWANYETWNVVLWINNDEGLYNHARDLMDAWNEDSHGSMDHFYSRAAREVCSELFPSGQTPDGVKLSDSRIDWIAIVDMLLELWEENAEPSDIEQCDEFDAIRIDPPIG
jgi:hypothetical protein